MYATQLYVRTKIRHRGKAACVTDIHSNSMYMMNVCDKQLSPNFHYFLRNLSRQGDQVRQAHDQINERGTLAAK